MRRFGAVSLVTSAVVLFLAFAVVCSRPAGAQDAPPPPASSGVPAVPSPTPPPPPASGASAVPPPAPLGGLATASAPAATPKEPPTRREQLKSQTIDQVMGRLATIQQQQAELEKEKKEAEAVLKEKLKEQKEKLKKLGVNVEEGDRPPAKVPVVAPSVGATY